MLYSYFSIFQKQTKRHIVTKLIFCELLAEVFGPGKIEGGPNWKILLLFRVPLIQGEVDFERFPTKNQSQPFLCGSGLWGIPTGEAYGKWWSSWPEKPLKKNISFWTAPQKHLSGQPRGGGGGGLADRRNPIPLSLWSRENLELRDPIPYTPPTFKHVLL